MSNPEIPFFSAIPDAALPATQRLWDAIDVPGYNALTAYNAFVMDVREVGLDAPPRAAVRRWAAGVEAGLIDRPVTGENKLRVKRTAESSPPALEETTAESAPASAPVSTRKAGTLKLRRGLSDSETATLNGIMEVASPVDGTPAQTYLDNKVGASVSERMARGDEVSVAEIISEMQANPITHPIDAPDRTNLGAINPPPSMTEEYLEKAIESDNYLHEIVSDPVQDAVDIIVKHYHDQEIAKARSVAAVKAAAALREFANRIEASA